MTPTKTPPTTASGSLIRAVEIWIPDAAGTLAIEQSFYTNAPTLAAASETVTFESGVGLPGQVFASRTPIVFRDFGDSDFQRTKAATADGIVAGFGVPVIKDDQCTAVVVMLFGSDSDAVGAMESWTPVRERNELTLASSFYAGMPQFEKISKYVQFPRDSGLPGTVWASHTPSLLTGLAKSKSFMRAAGAGVEGLSSAIAWPVVEHADKLHAVCVLLSASRSPLAAVMQVWEPHANYAMVLTRTDASVGDPLREACRENPVSSDDDFLGAVVRTGVPKLYENLNTESNPIAQAATKSGLSRAVVVPVFAGSDFCGAVALWD